jgi:hypothetical protein
VGEGGGRVVGSVGIYFTTFFCKLSLHICGSYSLI